MFIPGNQVRPALLDELTSRVGGNPSASAALVAVLELHTPYQQTGLVCYAEGHDGEPWPCPTVCTIATALGVPVEAPGG